MTTDTLRLANAHNIFSKLGESGVRAKYNDRSHKQVVNDCVKALEKNGVTECFYEEQLRDIQLKSKHETEFEKLDNEIKIWVKERNDGKRKIQS